MRGHEAVMKKSLTLMALCLSWLTSPLACAAPTITPLPAPKVTAPLGAPVPFILNPGLITLTDLNESDRPVPRIVRLKLNGQLTVIHFTRTVTLALPAVTVVCAQVADTELSLALTMTTGVSTLDLTPQSLSLGGETQSLPQCPGEGGTSAAS